MREKRQTKGGRCVADCVLEKQTDREDGKEREKRLRSVAALPPRKIRGRPWRRHSYSNTRSVGSIISHVILLSACLCAAASHFFCLTAFCNLQFGIAFV
ncbi:hypothetical protein ACTXT7_001011 [Hymenolepis weldensis]